LEETFGRFDVDQNGFITLEQASGILREEPFRFPPDKVLRLLKRFDRDGNGKLDYREFSGFYAEAKARYIPRLLSLATTVNTLTLDAQSCQNGNVE